MSARAPVALEFLVPPRPFPWRLIFLIGVLAAILVTLWLVLRKKSVAEPMRQPETPMRVPPPVDDGIPARFTVVTGQERGHVYPIKLGTKTVVGRDADCQLVIAGDQEVSGRHCEITRNGTRIEIVDLGSRNGTLLNGAPVISRQRVENGDLIRVGRTEFRLSMGEQK